MNFSLKCIAAMTLLISAVFFYPSFTVMAGEYEDGFDCQSQFEASGAADLFDELPDYAAESMSSASLRPEEILEAQSLDTAGVLNSVISSVGTEIKSPLAALGVLLAVLLPLAVVRSGESALEGALRPSAEVAASLAAAVVMIVPSAALIDSSDECVAVASRFTQSFGLVFAGILVANGQTASAAGYSTFIMGATGAASVCVGEVIMPMLRIFLALSCVSAVSESVRIDALIAFFEKYSKWLLGFLGVIISTVLGISGIISASADSVASRAAKFVISGSVPVVGGAVSDAYLSIKSGMAMLRNSVGAFGIIAAGYIFLPVIIRIVLWRLAVGIGQSVCDTLGLGDVGKLLKSLSSTLSLMLGTVVFSLFLLTLAGVVVIMQQPI